MNKKYDTQIQCAIKSHLQGTDWRLLKAQLQAESGLNPDAISPAGAMGIAQFMPDTWEDMIKELNYSKSASPFDSQLSIIAAAYYMRKMWNIWTAQRPEADRYALALASYNAGAGNIINAQKQAKGAADYYTISKHLHLITGQDHSEETRTYVTRIYKTYGEYVTEGR